MCALQRVMSWSVFFFFSPVLGFLGGGIALNEELHKLHGTSKTQRKTKRILKI